MASSKLETKLLSWGKTYAAVLMGLPTESTLTEASAKLRQILQDVNTANKQKELLDSLHREIFSDAGVLDIVEIAKLLKNKQKEL